MSNIQRTSQQLENDKIIESLMENGFVLDNHQRQPVMAKVSHFAIFEDTQGEEHVVFIPHERQLGNTLYPYCSVNEIVLGADGLPHLSTRAVGGVLEFSKYNGLKETVQAYNEYNSPRWAGKFLLVASLSDDPKQEFIHTIH